MSKRRKVLGMLVSIFVMALTWQLSDSGVIPTQSFEQKLLAVSIATGGIFALTYLLLGKEGQPI